MAHHRINMTANFSDADAAIKNTINNMRTMTNVANAMGGNGNAGVAKFVKEMQNLDSQALTTRQRMIAMNTLLKEQEMAYNRLSPAARKLYGADWQASIDNARAKVAEYNRELQNVGAAGMNGVSSIGGGFMKGIVGYQMLNKAIQLGAQTVKYAINTNMDFEQSNATLAAVLGKTRGEIEDLTMQAKKLGAETFYTAGQITGLQTELARLGFTQPQIHMMTDDITKLAFATGDDLSHSASLAGSTLRAFNMHASETDRVASVLAVSTTKSALTMESLGTAMPYVASAAKQFGFSLEDTVALLGTLMNAGFKASTAGMAVRNIMSAIANQSGKLSQAMGRPVKTLDDFVEGLKQMKKDGANLDDIASIINLRTAPALSRFVDGADSVRELRDAITDCHDEMDKMAEEMENTASFSATRLSSAWDGLMLTFSKSNGFLKETLDDLTKILNKITEARKLAIGGGEAVSIFEYDLTDEDKKQLEDIKKAYADKGLKQEQIDAIIQGQRDKRNANIEKLEAMQKVQDGEKGVDLVEAYLARKRGYISDNYDWYKEKINGIMQKEGFEEWFKFLQSRGGEKLIDDGEWDRLWKIIPHNIAENKHSLLRLDYLDNYYEAEKLKEANKTGDGADYRDEFGDDEKTLTEIAAELVETALRRYKEDLRELQNRLDHGLIDQAGFYKGKLGLDERVFEAYNKANTILPAKKYANGVDYWVSVMKGDADLAQKSGAIKKMVAAEQKYAKTYDLAAMKEEQGLQDSIAANKQRLGAEESLYNAYANLYAETKDPKYLEEMNLLAEAIKSWREIIKEQEDELKRQQQQRAIYNRALNGIESTARSNNIRYEDIGVGGFKQKISDNLMDDETMQGAVDKLNEQLKTKGIRWTVQLDLETGTLEKLKSRLDEVFDGFGKGIGGIKSIVGALDSVKSAGESLKETLEGDADGWEKMMAVFNMAMAPLEAAITIYEAINALKEMSMILSAKETANKIAEVSSTVSGTQAEVVAETEKMAVDKAATKTAMELATANFMAAHAAIPFAGFAIGSGFAGGALALTKANGMAALAFHDGGIVPGAYNGGRDTVPAMLSPQEIVLNRAQTNNLAAQLVPAHQQQAAPMGSPYVTGEYIWLGLSNYLQRTGRGEIVTTRR